MKLEEKATKRGAYALLLEKRRRLLKMTLEKPPAVHTSTSIYLAALSVGSFAALIAYFAFGTEIALILTLITWLVVPCLGWTDRLVFDGRTLRRRGALSFIIEKLTRKSAILRLAEIETVETDARRTIERDGKVFYFYQTTVKGSANTFRFSSGGKNYRLFAKSLLGSLNDEKLDLRSIDLCLYLTEPEAIKGKLGFYRVPSAEFLPVRSVRDVKRAVNLAMRRAYGITEAPAEMRQRAENLHVFANELRIEGRLRQSAEVFRRALQLSPENARLLFDYARCMFSLAMSEENERGTFRARAVLRLAQQRTVEPKLLAQIGQSFLHLGDIQSAEKVFRGLKEKGRQSFRAERGLAEISIGKGKLAHAIQHFAASAEIAPNVGLRNWAKREAAYFQQLNYDEAFLLAELKRIDWLTNVRESRRSLLKFIFPSLLFSLIGAFFNSQIGLLGISCAASLILAWLILTAAKKILDRRKMLTGE